MTPSQHEPVTVTRFARLAAAAPGAPCIDDRWGMATCDELRRRVDGIRRQLVATVHPGALVGVLCERDRDLVACLLAVHAAGAAYVPLDSANPDERLAAIIADARPALVVSNTKLAARLPMGTPTLLLDDRSTAGPVPDPGASRSSGDLAYVMYTSGTTGNPKGVAIGHRALGAFFEAMDTEVGAEPDQVWMAVSSVGFDSSVAEILWPVVSGHTLCIGDNTPLGILESQIVRGASDGRRVTHMQGTPSVMRLLMADPSAAAAMPRLHAILLGGEAYPIEVVDRLHADGTGPRLLNVYGPTETTVWVARSEVRADSPRPVPIGDPVAGAALYVCDSELIPVPRGDTGRLYVGGAQVGHGYVGRPALTAEAFLPDPFNGVGRCMYDTGDLARVTADGIVVIGRADDQIKVRGHRVEIGEVEAVLRACPGIADAACLIDAAADGGSRLVAVLVAAQPESAAVDDWLVAHLPAYMIPERTVFVPAMAVSTAGKVDRRSLAAQLGLPVAQPTRTTPWPGSRCVVVRNGDGRTALWAAERAAPPGWAIVHGPFPRAECLHWVDATQAQLLPTPGHER